MTKQPAQSTSGRLVSLNNAYNIRNQPAHFDVGTINRLNLGANLHEFV
jgi:hypothetical protein